MDMLTFCRRAVYLPLVVVTAGCGAGLGTLGTLGTLAELVGSIGRPGASPQQVQLTAEVRQVDTRRQILQVATQDGRAGGVLFDLGTVVLHDEQPYPLSALEPGDVVNLQLEQAPQNNLYASRIEVVRRVREDATAATAPAVDATAMPAARVEVSRADTTAADTAAAPRLQRLEGEVGQIDTERGTFQLRMQDRGTLTVSLPYNPPAQAVERFRRLRSGDAVRVEGHPLSGSRVELSRFLPED